jgi:hypothetical protein
MPARVLDLYVEFKLLSNGVALQTNKSLLGFAANFGVDGFGVGEKKSMQLMIAERGRSCVGTDREAVLDYCEADVTVMREGYPKIEPHIDFPRALLRGRYMTAVARMEAEGVPVDTELHGRIVNGWEGIQEHLIQEVDAPFGVYKGRTFRHSRFRALTERLKLWWPELPSGQQCLDADTFRDMAKVHPVLAPLRELRHALGELRLNDLSVGRDQPQPLYAVAFCIPSRSELPVKQSFHFWTGSMAAVDHSTSTRLRYSVHRLESSGIRNLGRTFWRREYDPSLPDRRRVFRVRRTSLRCTPRGH